MRPVHIGRVGWEARQSGFGMRDMEYMGRILRFGKDEETERLA